MQEFLKYLVACLIIVSFQYQCTYAQVKSTIDTLTQDQIKNFEKTAKRVFYDLENLTLLIIDKEEDIDERYDARFLAKLFFFSNANIQDDLGRGNNFIEVLEKNKYYNTLFDLANTKNEFTKEFTLLSVEEFNPTIVSINLDHQDTFRVYEGELTFLDFTSISDVVERNQLSPENTYTRKNEQYKKMILQIRKTMEPYEKWQLYITKITVLDKKDLVYKATKKIEKKSKALPSSARLLIPKSPKEVKSDIMKDPLIADEHKKNLDSLLSVIEVKEIEEKPYKPYLGLNTLDFVLPGKGHLKFNRKNKSIFPATAYAVLGIGSVASTIYFKVKSNKYYSDHLDDTIFKELDQNYELANKYHHYYLISAGSALLIWTANAVDLLIKDKKYKPANNKNISFQIITPVESDLGLGLIMNF